MVKLLVLSFTSQQNLYPVHERYNPSDFLLTIYKRFFKRYSKKITLYIENLCLHVCVPTQTHTHLYFGGSACICVQMHVCMLCWDQRPYLGITDLGYVGRPATSMDLFFSSLTQVHSSLILSTEHHALNSHYWTISIASKDNFF